jgi:CubicO group peptidase (beta-lactamase class C family)
MNKRYFSFVFILLLGVQLSFIDNALAQKRKERTFFPEATNWEKRSPEVIGMDAALLQEAISYAIENESSAPRDLKKAHYQGFGREPFGDAVGPFKERGEPTGLIIKGGYIVAEWGDPAAVNMTFSVSKSFLSSVVGLAYDDGLIKDLDDKVYTYMAPVIPYRPATAGLDKAKGFDQQDVLELFETTHNRKISWDHLLRQTSDWQGTLWGKPDWADRPEGEPATWLERERHEPGTRYKYNDVRVNLLALSVMNLWRKPLPQVLKERIMDPIGASDTWRWLGYENSWIVMDGLPMQVVSGGGHWGGGMFISALDQARLGYLTLHRGNWNGKQLLSEEWISKALTPTPVQPTYGFMNYFLNTDKAFFSSAPATAYAHLGAGTNMVYVDPEHDLIIVARWIERNALDGLIEQVLKSIK